MKKALYITILAFLILNLCGCSTKKPCYVGIEQSDVVWKMTPRALKSIKGQPLQVVRDEETTSTEVYGYTGTIYNHVSDERYYFLVQPFKKSLYMVSYEITTTCFDDSADLFRTCLSSLADHYSKKKAIIAK